MKTKIVLIIFFSVFVLQNREVIAQVGASVYAGKWYRIAENTGSRANASFTLRDFISSGGHSTLEFRVGISFNFRSGISFSLINHNYYGNLTFSKVRVLSKNTYDPQYIEVFVNRTGSVNFSIYDNLQSSGWNEVSWIVGNVPAGYVASEFNVNNLFVIGDTQNRFSVARGGNVGIGTSSPDFKLDVLGTIRARELKVDMQGADFVFEEDYPLRPISELEDFVKTNKHLPEIAPAKEMQENGINQSEMNQKLLQKIEELTLYVIEINKTNEILKKRVEELEK